MGARYTAIMNPTLMHTVEVSLAERSYSIRIGRGLLGSASSYAGLPSGAHAVIVTNPTVAKWYAASLEQALDELGRTVHTVTLPDGEAYKDWTHLQVIFDALLAAGCDRNTVLFALGGGVVGDMAGFAAACYMRGVPFVQVPTTLLAQVDSSVGGKTGINHPAGKNMIGAFYQPLRVVCDLDALTTLPARELHAGLAEVIKYGPIADVAFLDWLEQHLEALLALDAAALAHAVRRSCEIKAEVVGADEREAGLRAVLNFGHTFGHAIEAGLGYGTWLHGEAVACGMVMASLLAAELGLLPAASVQRIVALLMRAGLPIHAPVLDHEDNAGRYLQLMRVDKKAKAGAIQFVLPGPLGRAQMQVVPDALVRRVIDHCTADAPASLSK